MKGFWVGILIAAAGMGWCAESPHLDSPESREEYGRIKRLPPGKREAELKKFNEKHRFHSAERDSADYRMSAKDRAEYERIKKLPPSERGRAIQDYKAKNAGAFRNRKEAAKESPAEKNPPSSKPTPGSSSNPSKK